MKVGGDLAIHWVQMYCSTPSGKRVILSMEDRARVRGIYASQDAETIISGPLAAFLTVYHLCGPAALKRDDFRPSLDVDFFTLWSAAGPDLRTVLKREGEHVVCPPLGTRWPSAA